MKQRIAAIGLFVTLCALLALPLSAAGTNEINAVHQEQELTCGDCHDGNENPTTAATAQACIDCHTDMMDAEAIVMIEKGHRYEAWVHDPHEVVPNSCVDCHKQHEPTVLYCNISCHAFDTKVP